MPGSRAPNQRRAMFARMGSSIRKKTIRSAERHPFTRELAIGAAGTLLGSKAEGAMRGFSPIARQLATRGRFTRGAIGVGIGLLAYTAADSLIRRASFGKHEFKVSKAGAKGALYGLGGGLLGGYAATSPGVRKLGRYAGQRLRSLR